MDDQRILAGHVDPTGNVGMYINPHTKSSFTNAARKWIANFALAALNMKFTLKSALASRGSGFFVNPYLDSCEKEITRTKEKLGKYFAENVLDMWMVELGVNDWKTVNTPLNSFSLLTFFLPQNYKIFVLDCFLVF